MHGALLRLRPQVAVCGVLLGLLLNCGCTSSGHPKPPPRTLNQPPTPAEKAALQRQAQRLALLEAKQQAQAEQAAAREAAAQKAAQEKEAAEKEKAHRAAAKEQAMMEKKAAAQSVAAQKVAEKQAARRAAVERAAAQKAAATAAAQEKRAAREAAAQKAAKANEAAAKKAAKEKAAKAKAAASKKKVAIKTAASRRGAPKPGQAPAAPAPSSGDEYILQPGDEIELQIYREPEMSGTFRLNPAGEIRHPLAGSIPLAGQNLAAAEADLTDHFNQHYLVNPSIIVKLVTTTGGQIVLLGEVKKPGVYPLAVGETMTLLQAIAGAGGFTDLASPDRVRIVRRQPDGTQKTLPVRVSDLLRGKGKQQDIPLEPNDVITVPEVFF